MGAGVGGCSGCRKPLLLQSVLCVSRWRSRLLPTAGQDTSTQSEGLPHSPHPHAGPPGHSTIVRSGGIRVKLNL